MSLLSQLQTVSNWTPLVLVRDSKLGMPIVQAFHLTGLTLLLATIVIQNMRVAGWGLREIDPAALVKQLRPWTLGGVGLVVLSGVAIFLATPEKYLGSTPFRLKMALLCAAAGFHFGLVHRFTAVAANGRRRSATIAACLSLALWFSVGWAGRAIAFLS